MLQKQTRKDKRMKFVWLPEMQQRDGHLICCRHPDQAHRSRNHLVTPYDPTIRFGSQPRGYVIRDRKIIDTQKGAVVARPPLPQREPLSPTDTIGTLLMKMAEGNMAAVVLLARLLREKQDVAIPIMLDLDDMGMRGEQIWAAYQGHCQENMDFFVAAVHRRSPELVAAVNRRVPERKAVTSSFITPGRETITVRRK